MMKVCRARGPAAHVLTDEQNRRWGEMLDNLAGALPPDAVTVLLDGDGHTALVADRLAATLQAAGRPSVRLTDATPLPDEDAWRVDRTRDTVTVEVFEGPPASEDGFVWFDGVIVSARGTFIVHDPDEDVRLVVRTDHPGEVRLRIASDVEWRPTSVRLNFWY